MKVDSSFCHLFRQSRFARDFEDDASKPRHNRRELFAVAAVAFVVKHDPIFAQDFLLRVAGVPKADLKHNFEISPQADHCADLLVKDCTSGQGYVVEFKVHAPIEDKQSPDKDEFGRSSGYGSRIRKRFGGMTKTYTILSTHQGLSDRMSGGIFCRERGWKELIPVDGKERPIVKDLLDSLGDFGIPVLRLRNISNMKNSNHVLGAIQISELLETVLTEFRASTLETGADEIYRWCGMSLAVRKGQYRDLRRWLGHKWRNIGWVGYLLPKGAGEPELSVWLYFGRKQSVRRDRTIEVLRRRLPDKNVRAFEKGMDVVVSESARRVKVEKEWFSSVLNSVLNANYRLRPKRKA